VRDLFRAPRHPYTAALLSSLPERAGDSERLPVIRGVVPGQFDRPEGCLFHPRCPRAEALCRETPPVARPDDPALALCHFPLGAEDRT
jgi:dipeptide transport system ATP-binding protein